MSINFQKIIVAAAICSLGAFGLAGCGGGGSNDSQTRKGQVRLNISWTDKRAASLSTRYIPVYASSLFFELYPKDNPNQRYTLTANRPPDKPSTQQVTFNELLPSGTYELAGAARALADAQGATVASGAVEINVQPGINAVALTLNSTVKSLLVLGQPLAVGVGQNATLQSGAFDPDGAGLLLPDGALTWSVVSGSQFGSISPGGKLAATAAGTMRVRVAEPVTGVKAEADVVISLQSSTSGLANSGYPKAGADAGNTGQVQGSGAVGQIAWTFDLGGRGVNTPVLGNNNLLFAYQQNGVIFALDATTGAKKWQATLPNMGKAAFGSSLIAGDDNTIYVGYDMGVQAYDAATGLPKWNNSDFQVTGGINLASGKIYAPSLYRGVGVIDARTGTTLTNYPGLTYSNDVVIGSGFAYFTTENPSNNGGIEFHAVNLATGTLAWKKTGGISGGVPAVGADGTVYLGLADGTMNAFDGQSGATKASAQAGLGVGFTNPIIASDSTVYFRRRDANFKVQTVHYDAGLTQQLGSSPILVKQLSLGPDATLYGSGFDIDNRDQTSVYALNSQDGTVKWKTPLTAGVLAAPPGDGIVQGYVAVSKTGMVYVVAIDQRLYAIK